MATFKLVVSDPKTGKSEQHEIKDDKARTLVGRKIGEEIEGELIGISGVVLRITGGSDKDGFPMRGDLPGTTRRKLLLSKGLGYKPKENGKRMKKSLRGNTINPDVVQINMKVIKHSTKPIEDLIKVEKKEEADKKEEQ